MKIMELGFIDKGTGKHQSNTVYGAGDCSYFMRWFRHKILDTDC